MRFAFATLASLALTGIAIAQTYSASTFAGGALPINIQGTSASLYGPQSAIATDPTGNVYFADGNTILRLDAASGLITLVAGNGTSGYSGDNGPATSAQLRNPYGLAIDSAGNLYISCISDNVIRKVSGGVISTIAGTGVLGYGGDNSVATSAQLNTPNGLALDAAGNLYIADFGNNRVREISGGVITTVAGTGAPGSVGDNGLATSAQLSAPFAVALDSAGNLYITDRGNNRIRKVSNGVITTVAGSGTPGYSGDNGDATTAQLNLPCGIAIDAAGNLLIADYYNYRIRQVSNGVITTAAGKGTQGFSGDNGPAMNAQLNDPFVLAFDSAGNLYVGDYGNNRIRKITSGAITTVAGNGSAGFSGDGGAPAASQLHAPYSVALSTAGDFYTADSQNNRVRGVSAGIINTVAGNGIAGFSGDSGQPSNAQLNQPGAVALEASGNLYIADTGNNRIRKISAGVITTVAGNGVAGFGGDTGQAISAQLNQPTGIALDASGNIYIADSANHRIRKVSGSTITTVAGNGTPGFSGDTGQAINAQLNMPLAVAVDSAGNLYIADSINNRIRKVAGGVISTVVGSGVAGNGGDNGPAAGAQLYAPAAITVTSNGTLYISDTLNNAVRKVSGGTITTIANTGLAGPQGVGLDAAGNIYVADSLNNRIRLLTPVPLSVAGPTSLLPGTVGTVYGAITFTGVGGIPAANGSYTWSATGLPAGLTMSTAGVLSGTPTAASSGSPQFTVKDSALHTASLSLPLTIDFPVPVISTLSPAAATQGAAGFTLTVNGAGFVTGAAIQWNGAALVTKLVNATQLTAPVTAALIASPGTATIAVNSGGTVSDTISLPINPPTPTLTAINPKTATATGAGFTLTGTGTGFVQATQLQWNGTPLQTTFVSATQVTATVTADLIGSAGTASVVANSGGASSTAQTFTIAPPPTIASLAPASVTAYGPAFTLTVTGTGFATGAVVQWDGTALTTKVVSATQLTVSVPANTIAGAGSVNIVVIAGAVSSGAFQLPVTPQPPAITTLLPTSAIATGTAFTLTVNGTGFTQSATVQWNGADLPTTFVGATQLTAYVSTGLIASAGTATITVNIAATASAAMTFRITAPPAITTLSPASVVVGGPAFTLALTGTGFVSGAQVQWNGAALPTTFVSATQMKAAVAANLLNSVGSVTVTVFYAGASSTGTTFPINGPPAITSLSPAAATSGGAAFTLTVTGTGFATGAAVTWNGTSITTKFVSATQVTASVTASLIANAGTANIAVNLGGAVSAPLAFPINAPPAIASLNPGTVAGSGAPFTLTIIGTGFQTGTTVAWNGTPLTTTYISATQLTASVPANMAAGTGTASIIASNPGGGASTAAKLSITASPPSVSTGGVVPLYSSTSVIQAGSWISIYGNGLANGTYTWKGDYPTTLGGTSVKINNKAAYLWSVSPTQINVQAPNDATTGSVNVSVTSPSGTTTSTVSLAAFGPSFSLLPASNYAASVILTQNGFDLAGPVGMFTFDTRPVRPGETLELYGVGFGPTAPTVPAGKAYTGAAPTTNTVTVTVGGIPAKVLFAGAVGSGVYQLNIIVPSVGSGDQPLVASVSSVQTPAGVLLAIQ